MPRFVQALHDNCARDVRYERMNFHRDLVADGILSNNFHRNGFANGVIIFFFPPLFLFISLRVARREETTAKVVPFAESFRPGRLITILLWKKHSSCWRKKIRERRKKRARRSNLSLLKRWFPLRVTLSPRILFFSISRDIARRGDRSNLCVTERIRWIHDRGYPLWSTANSTNFVLGRFQDRRFHDRCTITRCVTKRHMVDTPRRRTIC